MKTRVLLLATLCSMAIFGANPVPNGDFENWQTGSYSLPSGFPYSSNMDRFFHPALPYNVEQTTDAKQGQYAVKLTTGESFGDGPNFGYLLNYPTDERSTTGFPLNETPTGLRGYYKYQPVDNDSGVILVNLLKGGSKVAEYYYIIKGEQTSYVRFELPFNKPLSEAPDAIQIGFASSFSQSMSGKVGTTLYLDSIGLMGVSAQPQALAGDFETWTLKEHHQPVAWMISGQTRFSEPKTTVSKSGTYALELKSFIRTDGDQQRAEHRRVSLGYWNEVSQHYEGRMGLSGSEDTLSFYYSFQPGVSNHSSQVNVRLYQGNNEFNTINIPLFPTQGYEHLNVPLNLHQPFSPTADSLLIEFVSGMWSDTLSASAANVLRVDAVTLLDYKGDNPQHPQQPGSFITDATLFPNGGFESWNEFSYEFPANYGFNANSLTAKDGGQTMTVHKTSDAQHGSHALRLISQNNESDMDFGFVLNVNGNDGDPSTWVGGFPVVGRPTGISGYYKYNEATRDSGLVIVGFNKNGQVLHTYMLPLGGAVSTFTAFDFTFDPPLAEDPDNMVLGFASSNHMQGGALMGAELIVDNVSIKGVSNQPVNMNGDFEAWQTETTYSPIAWYYDSWIDGNVVRTTETASGNYAVCLTTVLVENEKEGTVFVPGSLSNGYWDDQSGKERGGTAFSNTKDTLVFMYKYHPANSDDRGMVSLNFLREGNSIWNTYMSLTPSNTYKKAQLPINLYQFTWLQQPDSVVVSFRSSQWYNEDSSYVGSTLWVDEVHFASEFYLPPPYNPTAPNSPVPNGNFEQWKTLVYDTPLNFAFSTDKKMQPWYGIDPFVTKTTQAQSGNFALKLTSRSIGNNEIITGFVSNYNVDEGEPSTWHGGIPVTEKPTGMKGYYTYNMSTEDTAIIVAAFSKAGVNLGSYIIKLSGPKAVYSPFEYTFDPPLAETPDSMILAIASSYAVYEHAFDGSELCLDALELTGVTEQPLLMNGGFENWTTESTEKPLNWALMGSSGSMAKSAVAQDGQHALALHTAWNEEDSRVVAGTAVSTDLSLFYNLSEAGFPFTKLRDTLAFYYKFTPTNQQDTALVSVFLNVSSTGDMQRINLSAPRVASMPYSKAPSYGSIWNKHMLLEPTSTYQYVEIPFDVTSSSMLPDRMIIMARSTIFEGDNPAYVGGELLIDNFHFKSLSKPVRVEMVDAPSVLSLYPNPTRGLTRLMDMMEMFDRIDVYTLMGLRVKSYSKDKADRVFDMDLTGQPAGLYMIRVSSETKQETLKLMLK